jgi:hypothetical protein
VLPLDSNLFGWVAVPTQVLQPIADSVNELFGGARVTRPVPETGDLEDLWTVTAIGQ